MIETIEEIASIDLKQWIYDRERNNNINLIEDKKDMADFSTDIV